MKTFLKHPLFLLFFSAFVFRFFLSFLGFLQIDFYTFLAWSHRLVNYPLPDFYKEWSDYLPGYLYMLFVLGEIKKIFNFIPNEILYKMPAIIADLVTAFLIYKVILRLKDKKLAFWASFLYLFNPAIFANSSLWGQVDSLTVLFSLLAIYLFEESLFLSAGFLAFAVSVKIQAALALVPVLFLFWKNKIGFRKFFSYGGISLLVFLITFLPFFPFGRELGEFPLFVLERIRVTLNQYPYTSVNAFNFWALFGFWQPNRDLIPSFLSFAILFFVSALSFWKLKKIKGAPYLILGLVFAVSFIFFPRMHERHLLPVFAPLLISASLFADLFIIYGFLSLLYCLNLYYSFVWLTDHFRVVFSDFVIKNLVVLEIFSFALWLKIIFSGKTKLLGFFTRGFNSLLSKSQRIPLNNLFPKVSMSSKMVRFFLILIMVFAFTSRVYRLGIPEKEYFDEVYHAFTARLMLHNDPKAWEWWNPHPSGFAYEWSHPPLAKLGMQLGMFIFGENAFGWRFPAALLGTLSVLLVYLIAKEIFNDQLASLFSALVFSLDGLFLVTTRIGMNDAYLLFFSLLAVYLFIKDRIFFSSLAFGLALSSKWSAVWVVPILVSGFFAFGKKLKSDYFWFLVLPPLVYIASYTQMFLTGHSFDIFVGVQKQMWWYHTGLRATHPYTSSFWSWPLLLRPIWLYTSSFGNGRVANIYAFGNPAVFWFGLASVFITFYYAYFLRNKRLGWLVFSYLVFFVPWAVSPRIMFLYHYLPSIPFLAISAGFVLRKNSKLSLFFFIVAFLIFIYFYPHLIGLPVGRQLDNSYYWFSSWR